MPQPQPLKRGPGRPRKTTVEPVTLPADPRLVSQIHELQELAAETTRRQGAHDPVAFARSLSITDPDGNIVPFQPDPWQIEVLAFQGDRLILNVGRQSGKSTVIAVVALHRAIYVPNSLVLIVSGAQRQSDELFRKVLDFLSRLPFKIKLSEDNKRSIELQNGSRIVALPANDSTIRGFSAPAIVIEDESAEVPDAVHTALRPMLLRSKGRFIMSGTPKGRKGHFFDVWQRADPKVWKKIKLKSEESSASKEVLAKEKADLASRGLEDVYRQEYECEFIDAASGRVYAGFDEQRNLIAHLPPNDPIAPWMYVLGLDFGIVDPNAASVLAWRQFDPTIYMVESYRFKGDALVVADEVHALSRKYTFAKIVGDEGGLGKEVATILRQRAGIPISAAEKHNKNAHISFFNGALRTSRIKIIGKHCEELIAEWLSLGWALDGSETEGSGLNHAADATLYAWRSCHAYAAQPRPVPTGTYGTADDPRFAEQRRRGRAHQAYLNSLSPQDRTAQEYFRGEL